MVEKVSLYVEGGGDSKSLKTACRKAFSAFIKRAGVGGKMPELKACGGRGKAFDRYCTAIESGKKAMLLVDSESSVDSNFSSGEPNDWQPWSHLKARDDWDAPANSNDKECHLMVQVMETWFIADRETLKAYFGDKFKNDKLPAANRKIESVAKPDVYKALKEATKDCQKGVYGKGDHSFEILERIDPAKVIAASPWAKRFIVCLKTIMNS